MTEQVEVQEDDVPRRRVLWWWALPVAVLVALGTFCEGLSDGRLPSDEHAMRPPTRVVPSPLGVQAPALGGGGVTTTSAAGSGALSAAGTKPAPAATPAPAVPPPKQLAVAAGSVQGLVLTSATTRTTTTVPVTISNPNSGAVVVSGVTPRVVSVDRADGTPASRCPLSTLRITPFVGALQVAGRGSGALSLPVQLVNDPAVNQDDCKRATFHVVYALDARSLT